MHVGIDLGTTYCCMAYVDDDGRVQVINNSDGEATTPSVIWFDGRQVYVGKKANTRKMIGGTHIYDFVKRDIGLPIEVPPNLYEPDNPQTPRVASYEIDRFKYGAAGMSAIILRKLKKEAILHFKKIGKLDRNIDEKNLELDAVITVPAYFGDKERHETKLAGYAAGLNVIAIINEPTAAALSFSFVRPNDQRILVFDLGGGTLDVTILRMVGGEPHVVSSVGNNRLGGRDWDSVIEQYIYEAFRRKNGRSIPDDPERAFEVQELALRAKLALSEATEYELSYSIEQGELTETIYRSAPTDSIDIDMDAPDVFYLDQRCGELLGRCEAICEAALVERLPTGEKRQLSWDDIDEIVLAGGACRMPMISEMLERISGKKIPRRIEGFDYDTAIAAGAALHGLHRGRVKDVLSHGLGVKVMEGARYFIEYLIEKDTPLPSSARRTYRAGPNATLEVYEGESTDPQDCTFRGQLPLDNTDGYVAIVFDLDTNGILRVTAIYPADDENGARAGETTSSPPSAITPIRKELELRNDLYMYDKRALPLRNKVQSLPINL